MTTGLTKQQRMGAIMALVCGAFLLTVMSIPTWLVPSGDGVPEYQQPRFAWWAPQVLSGGNIFPLIAVVATVGGVALLAFALIRRRRSWAPVVAYAVALACTLVGVAVNGSWRITTTVVGVMLTAIAMCLLLATRPRPRS